MRCPECGFEELETRKTIEDNEVIEEGWYCPDCEAEHDEEPTFWEYLDFPQWVRYESYNDTFRLLQNLRSQCEADRRTIPDEFSESGSDFKYTTFIVYFKVDEDGNVEGPYDEKEGELIHG